MTEKSPVTRDTFQYSMTKIKKKKVTAPEMYAKICPVDSCWILCPEWHLPAKHKYVNSMLKTHFYGALNPNKFMHSATAKGLSQLL